jgi:hypothetical protein
MIEFRPPLGLHFEEHGCYHKTRKSFARVSMDSEERLRTLENSLRPLPCADVGCVIDLFLRIDFKEPAKKTAIESCFGVVCFTSLILPLSLSKGKDQPSCF